MGKATWGSVGALFEVLFMKKIKRAAKFAGAALVILLLLCIGLILDIMEFFSSEKSHRANTG